MLNPNTGRKMTDSILRPVVRAARISTLCSGRALKIRKRTIEEACHKTWSSPIGQPMEIIFLVRFRENFLTPGIELLTFHRLIILPIKTLDAVAAAMPLNPSGVWNTRKKLRPMLSIQTRAWVFKESLTLSHDLKMPLQLMRI
jgi:hypothetical protein